MPYSAYKLVKEEHASLKQEIAMLESSETTNLSLRESNSMYKTKESWIPQCMKDKGVVKLWYRKHMFLHYKRLPSG